jgi:hypothetical protein
MATAGQSDFPLLNGSSQDPRYFVQKDRSNPRGNNAMNVSHRKILLSRLERLTASSRNVQNEGEALSDKMKARVGAARLAQHSQFTRGSTPAALYQDTGIFNTGILLCRLFAGLLPFVVSYSGIAHHWVTLANGTSASPVLSLA